MSKYCSAEACGPGSSSAEAELAWEKESPQVKSPCSEQRQNPHSRAGLTPKPWGVPLPSELSLPLPLSLVAGTAISDLSSLGLSPAHTQACRLYPGKSALPVPSQQLASSLPFPLPPSHCPTLKYTSPMNSFHWPWERGPISSGASNIILTIGLFTKGREVGYLTFVKQARLSGWIQSQDNDSRKP